MTDQNRDMESVASRLAALGHAVALTGAGISVESGIPDFRSPGGLWEKYSPEEYAHIGAFHKDPLKVWRFLTSLSGLVLQARPNPAHLALARLEERGILQGVITQNVDDLHQRAGSRRVVEYHGNGDRLVCLACDRRYPAERFQGVVARALRELEAPSGHPEAVEGWPPRCECGAILKPDVIFFGELIPQAALEEAARLIEGCKTLLVVGTSATVYPASLLPLTARSLGAWVVEVNLEPTPLTGSVSPLMLRGSASQILPLLVERVEAALG